MDEPFLIIKYNLDFICIFNLAPVFKDDPRIGFRELLWIH